MISNYRVATVTVIVSVATLAGTIVRTDVLVSVGGEASSSD
jgi:hypothetical protein